ncbi:MAG: hypothetical protein K2X73_04710 [Sphingomonas sp.]|uniref:hypothetical protein n=1 Tax=Sphingomonas sp. TaxID=28214 RepID=UPI0025EC36E5|nr:hypothetical protein [Sphingomonas sp.]MBX9881255.1 hypothetical protein [Sphingomonas sp.]
MKFGTWLVAQAGRDEWIGALARSAAADAAFPRDASPDEVRLRLGEMAADPDAFEQLDDAEREWVASLARAA